MKLRHLFEAANKHITFCFGRMNPPTIGHEQVFKTMSEQGGDYKIFVSQTQDKKDNPLDYKTKTDFIKKIHPGYAGNLVVDPTLNTVMKVASYLYDQGYTSATFVAGSDRLESFEKLLSQYNGVEGKAHGFYKFEPLNFVSSGDREDGAEGVAGISASGARAAAKAGDMEGFAAATGAGDNAEELYKAVRNGLGVKETVALEAPIEMDPSDPMDPMIYGTGANPGKLKYRMSRAAGQLKDLAGRVDDAGASEWQTMVKQFDELKMNIEQIKHGLEELAKIRKKGGIRSRGIDAMLDSIEENIMKAKDFIPVSKPRNFVVKNQKTAGAGAHKDKKRAEKQGDVKHKKQAVPMEGVAEVSRATIDRYVSKASDAHGDADFKARMSKNDPDKRSYHVDQKKTAEKRRQGISRALDRMSREESMSERVRDPEDWDEGNTEPPNNFAVYINGKKWKVFQGRGQFAGDYKELQHHRQLQNWAQAKSETTGKEWKVYVTGEAPTA